jgi:hypothetical protein
MRSLIRPFGGPVINPASNRPSYPGYVPPKPSTPPAAERTAFEEVVARTEAGRPSTASVDDGVSPTGIDLSLAYELASKRPSRVASVPQDLLWALTGPGRASGGAT